VIQPAERTLRVEDWHPMKNCAESIGAARLEFRGGQSTETVNSALASGFSHLLQFSGRAKHFSLQR
jgi:hypothetical protein